MSLFYAIIKILKIFINLEENFNYKKKKFYYKSILVCINLVLYCFEYKL